MRAALALVALLVAGCAAARVTAIDAVTGAPLAAEVLRELPDGRLLVGAEGHEVREARPGDTVSLAPLWEARFMDPGERPPPRPPRDGKPCCPGVQAR